MGTWGMAGAERGCLCPLPLPWVPTAAAAPAGCSLPEHPASHPTSSERVGFLIVLSEYASLSNILQRTVKPFIESTSLVHRSRLRRGQHQAPNTLRCCSPLQDSNNPTELSGMCCSIAAAWGGPGEGHGGELWKDTGAHHLPAPLCPAGPPHLVLPACCSHIPTLSPHCPLVMPAGIWVVPKLAAPVIAVGDGTAPSSSSPESRRPQPRRGCCGEAAVLI